MAPEGWHVPTNEEFTTLAGAVYHNGNTLKAIGQGAGGGIGTNRAGFSALLVGTRMYVGNFLDLGIHTFFWSSTEGTNGAYYMALIDIDSNIHLFDFHKGSGFSIRCVKD
jgi:uncharacterized protein (TIGR02145 family)